MAPSPTGNLHIGTARATLFNFLFARHTGGTFVMRIEDTDKERSRPEFERDIIDGLTWLGLSWDEFYRQSERTSVYTNALTRLIDEGKAYISKEPSKQDPAQTVEVVRLRNRGGALTFTDLIRGEITTDVSDLGDFVIARSMNDPLYHLAVVIDDGEMGITHVIRSDDHISNTPRQILIMEALGYERPVYVHQPLVLAPDRSKLSKRHGATSLGEYREKGFIKEAIINYLAFLGWNPGTDQEIFTLPELVEAFDIDKLQTSGAIFDMTRLTWYNREHIKRLSPQEFALRLQEFGVHADATIVPLLHDRVSTLEEARTLIESGEFSFMEAVSLHEAKLLVPKEGSPETTKQHLGALISLLEPLPSSQWNMGGVKEVVWDYAETKGKGAVLWPMRVALTGKAKSPDPFTVAGLIGKDATLIRLRAAAASL